MRKINDKPVVDATEPLTIHITQADCKADYNRKQPSNCGAARAIMRDYEVSAARVHVGITYVEQSDCWLRYMTPGSLRTEIVVFDRGGKMAPGEHTLTPPSPGMTLTYQRKNKKRDIDRRTRHDKNTKKLRHHLTGIRPHGANR